MPILFDKAPDDVLELLNQAMESYHPDLVENNVQVGVTMQTKINSDDEEIPSLKLHGAFANAVVKVVKRKDRTYIDHDAQITIDAVIWKTLSEPCKLALIDHELEHLRVKRDKEGMPKKDDLNRPVLGTIPDDFTLTGFIDIARRHGNAALEYQAVRRIHFAMVEAVREAGHVVADTVAGNESRSAA